MKRLNSEKVLERKLMTGVKELGGMAIKIHSANFSGMPDRLILLPGNQLFFAEMKSEGRKPSPVQEVIMKKLQQQGCDVRVIDTHEKLETFLNYLQYASGK